MSIRQFACLGKHKARVDKRTLHLHDYLNLTRLPPIPQTVTWSDGMGELTMMGNDVAGDCVEASAGHIIQLWTAHAQGQPTILTTKQILAAYSAMTGYNPRRPSTDNGTNMLDAQKWWRGIGYVGHKIDAFMAVNPSLQTYCRAAIHLFGALNIGLQMPNVFADQFDAGQVWDLDPNDLTGNNRPGSWGGHCVPAVDFTKRGVTVITWARKQLLSWRAFRLCCDEAYASLSIGDWLGQRETAPNGFNLAELEKDLARL